jgi:transposase
MERLPYGRHTKEFRQEAVKQIEEEGLSVHEAAKRLSLALTTLSNWVKAYKAGKQGEAGKNQRPLTEVELENYRLKKELAEVKMERDILKKAAAYFAKEPQRGAR